MDNNKLMEHGHSNLLLKADISEPVMMVLQLIGKLMLVHGKDGIWKDMEITFMFKVLNSNTIIGLVQDQF